jgi:hypothetical protein
MNSGELLLRLSAMLAVAGYAGRIAIGVAGLRDVLWQQRARRWWTFGAVCLALHTACAFHVVHHWSHAAAWEHTRARTQEMTGWNSGFGLYINFTLLAMWLLDVLGWRVRLDWPQRHPVWFWMVQAFFAFILFNATAVFGPWYWTPVVVAVIAALGVLRWRRSLGASRTTDEELVSLQSE